MVERLSVEVFKDKLHRALEKVKAVLHINKNPQFASDVHHQYSDKYLLAELLTRSAVASQVNCLETLGLKAEVLDQLRAWSSQHQHVSLSFSSEERCSFVREESKEVDNPTSNVTEGTFMGRVFTASSKLVTTVTTYFWKFEVSYKLEALRGVGEGNENRIELLTRSSHIELTTKTNSAPRSQFKVGLQCDMDISWLIRQLRDDNASNFSICRAHHLCYTPSRNPDTGAAIAYFSGSRQWFERVISYISDLFRSHSNYDPSYRSKDFFHPVLPLFDDSQEMSEQFGSSASDAKIIAIVSDLDAGDSSSKLLRVGDFNCFLAEELRCLRERRTGLMQAGMMRDQIELRFADTDGDIIELKCEAGCVNEYVNGELAIKDLKEFEIDVTERKYRDSEGNGTFLPEEDLSVLIERRDLILSSERFPAADGVATSSEAVLVMTLAHCSDVCDQYMVSIAFIEAMLREQLVAAIGKEVTPADFEEYMLFHNRKLFTDAYAPSLFCYSIRRSHDHTPEGTVSIERAGDTSIAQPIVTMSACSHREHQMEFALSASVNVTFSGHRYLHAYLQHQFSCNEFGIADSTPSLSLVSRARQFSAMIVLVGRIVSNSVFEPTHAIVVQNKDELRIPLEMTTIPAAQEFRDAIESLSPEQQSFAKAFRAMQLQSTLFGVLIVQIKPQLEKVLNLQRDSLTKEIKLTQELMQLFSTYQISSDLLSFSDEDGDASRAPPGVRLAAVRSHTKAMFDMINAAKKEEIEQQAREREYQEGLRREAERKRRSVKSRMVEEERCVVLECAAMPPPPPCAAVPPVAAKGAAKGGKGAAKGKGSPLMAKAKAKAPSSAPPPAPKPVPSPAPVTPQASSEPTPTPSPVQHQDAVSQGNDLNTACSHEDIDITSIPTLIDQRLENLKTRGTVRPVIISPGKSWQKMSQKALVASPTSSTLNADEQKKETNAAFDLLDALTKSGALPLEHANLHVVMAASHCFDQSLLATVIQENLNPIDQVERTSLTIASVVHQQPLAALVRDSQFLRLSTTSPELMDDDEASNGMYGSPSRFAREDSSRNSPQREVSVLGDGLSVRGVVGSFNSSAP